MTARAAPALLPREPTGGICPTHGAWEVLPHCPVCLYRAAPKIESAEAPGADTMTIPLLSGRIKFLEGVIAEHNKLLQGFCDERKRLGACTLKQVGARCECPACYKIEVGK